MRTLLTLPLLALLPLPALIGGCDHAAAFSTTPESAAPSSRLPAPASEDDPADEEQGNEGDETALPAAPRVPTADNTPHAFVSEVDRELGTMRTSTYSHRSGIDEKTGAFNFDCSGFVGYALEGSAPTAFQELRAATVKRPLAKHYEAFFASLPSADAPHWGRVAKVSDLEPGDIVAWLSAPGTTSKNTGHVVTVRGSVTPEPEHSGSYVVPIADSTSLRHGRTDSRFASKNTGLGTGTMVLVADTSGAPVAYRWSLGKKSRELATTFAMGRLSQR